MSSCYIGLCDFMVGRQPILWMLSTFMMAINLARTLVAEVQGALSGGCMGCNFQRWRLKLVCGCVRVSASWNVPKRIKVAHKNTAVEVVH